MRDHPRACGKNLMKDLCWCLRMRITPAHAGRIICHGCGACPFKDHPRACGKNAVCTFCRPKSPGSPPRMREESAAGTDSRSWTRITPAHAGRIRCRCVVLLLRGDHPRACGKNIGGDTMTLGERGSPPRMREECGFRSELIGNTGITPAHAGRIIARSYLIARRRGSPPRMREESFAPCPLPVISGITPAHAGRIAAVRRKVSICRGSPPRMREEFIGFSSFRG